MAAKKGNKKKTVKSKDNTDAIATNSSLLSSAIPGIILAIIAAAALWSPRSYSYSNSSAQDSSSSKGYQTQQPVPSGYLTLSPLSLPDLTIYT